MNRTLLAFCAGLLFGPAVANAQTPIDSSVRLYANRTEPEKIHIHFDKDTYFPGETVWMKAYLLSANGGPVSKNIYFDWTDADGKLILHSIAPVFDGAASSSFAVPGGLTGGVVHVKAYTQWMLNFDDAFLYNRDIPVLTMSDGTEPARKKNTYALQFFPEGGDLVNGLSSLVAYEAVDQRGRPARIRGAVTGSKGNFIDSIRTGATGMGTFDFKPTVGETYKASWTDDQGEKHSTDLPTARPYGLVMHVDAYAAGQFKYHLERNTDVAESFKKVTVVATAQQKLVYRNTVDLMAAKTFDGVIDAAKFPTGVVQVTILDDNRNAVAERVVFVNNRQAFVTSSLRRDLVSFEKRARNEVTIEIADSVFANLSVSVTDGGLGFDPANNIFADLLLNGDIKGAIVAPATFLAGSDSANQYMNDVLLTHGWRRFRWDEVVSGKYTPLRYAKDLNYLTLKGDIHGNTGFEDGDSLAVLLLSKDKRRNMMNMPVGNDGTFAQPGLLFYDSVQVVYKFNHLAKISDGSAVNIFSSLLAPLSPARAVEPAYAWIKVPDVVLENESNGFILETTDWTRKPSMSYVVTPKRDSLKNGTESASHYLAANFADMKFPQNIKETGNINDAHFVSYGLSGGATAQGHTVNLSLDGAPVTIEELKHVSMREVLFIKFVGKTSPKDLPTLLITTKQSLDQNNILNNKTGYAMITGYTQPKEFYAPAYTNEKVEDVAATDYRSTLYWNPRVIADKTHRKIKLTFYNNDISNKFRVVVEGIAKDGRLTRIDETLKP